MRTVREQNIEQVAGIIYENVLSRSWWYDPDHPQTPREYAEDLNDEGWSFEVNYDEVEYISDTDYTLVEDLTLRPDDFDRAYALAERWFKEYREKRT